MFFSNLNRIIVHYYQDFKKNIIMQFSNIFLHRNIGRERNYIGCPKKVPLMIFWKGWVIFSKTVLEFKTTTCIHVI